MQTVHLILQLISVFIIPLILVGFPVYGLCKRVPVYEEFVTGAKEGFDVAVRIIPYLVAILFAIAMALLVAQPSWHPAIVVSLLAGLGYYMLHNTLQTQATQMATEARGVALAWFASILWLGQGLGISAAAALAERQGFGVVFMLSGVALIALAANFAARLRRRQATPAR